MWRHRHYATCPENRIWISDVKMGFFLDKRSVALHTFRLSNRHWSVAIIMLLVSNASGQNELSNIIHIWKKFISYWVIPRPPKPWFSFFRKRSIKLKTGREASISKDQMSPSQNKLKAFTHETWAMVVTLVYSLHIPRATTQWILGIWTQSVDNIYCKITSEYKNNQISDKKKVSLKNELFRIIQDGTGHYD